MELSFDIINSEGDHLMVALSDYDSDLVKMFTSDPLILKLEFYDVTLVRKAGTGYVGYKSLFAVCDALARFLIENEEAVLCFYCDAFHDVLRSHTAMSPQEYRSNLFTRMFDMYMKYGKSVEFVNYRIEIEDEESDTRQFAHFICRNHHIPAVRELGICLMDK